MKTQVVPSRRLADHDSVCESCGKSFRPKARYVKRGGGRHCSPACARAAGRIAQRAAQSTPESTKQERVRAAGLVNKRLKIGWAVRPSSCQKCAKGKRVDAHHPNYGKPGEVVWLCRSCHMKTHWNPSYIDGLIPVDTAKPA